MIRRPPRSTLDRSSAASDVYKRQVQVEDEVIPYDFRLPNRISKTQLRTLRNTHENFAESLSSFLVTKLQTVVNIKVNSIDQILSLIHISEPTRPY